MRIRNNFKSRTLLKTIIIKKIHCLPSYINSRGNISILLATLALMFVMLFVSIFDIFQLYIAREYTKNASDAIALAVAQNLLFFDEEEIVEITDEISKKNDCDIDSIKFSYDEITVTTVKKVNFLFAGRIFKNSSTVCSTSKVKVTYPWDEKFGNCRFFKFDY